MIIKKKIIERPHTLCQVAEWSKTLEEFGMNLRDWQHEIQRGGIRNRPELSRRLKDAPPILRDRFTEGDVADGYLAAYAEWLADRSSIERPSWSSDPSRIAHKAWYATSIRGQLLAASPASFRQRNIFTIPDPIFHARPGRPRVTEKQKQEKARLRQKAYRKRIREILQEARAMKK